MATIALSARTKENESDGKPLWGNDLGSAGPPGAAVTPLVVTTYNYFDYFWIFLKNTVDMVDNI